MTANEAAKTLGISARQVYARQAPEQAMDNLDAYLAARPSAPTAVEPDERTFSQWFDSLNTEDRYDFDSFGRGFKKDPTVMMRMAWDAARASKGAP